MNNVELETKIDKLYAINTEMKEFNAMVSELKDEARALEEEITTMMADFGLSKAGTSTAQISISSQVVPSVDPDHWDEIRKWLVDNDYQELLPRSLNQAPYRELLNIGIEVPYVEKFDRFKMSVRKTT